MPPDTQKRERRPQRRLVPDLNDTIEAAGQKLTRVVRVEKPDQEETPDPAPVIEESKTLDSIARKHLGASVEELLGALDDEPEPEEPARIAPKAAASRLELYTDLDATPLVDETNPVKRAEGSVSPIVLTADAPDFLPVNGKIETLIDLFTMFPMLDGVSWYIHVYRKDPKIAYGMTIRGPQRRISRVLSYAEWQAIYGGGVFELIAYGPPKSGSVLNAHGVIPPRKLTEPFIFNFPGPPSTEGLVFDEDPIFDQGEQHLMNPALIPEGMLPRRPQTIAEGKVEEKRLEINDGREKRAESREEQERKEKERLLKEQANGATQMMAQFLEAQRIAADRESQLRDRMADREREHAREMKEFMAEMEERFQKLAGDKKPDDVERVINLTNALGKNGASADDLRTQHASEIQRLTAERSRETDNFQNQLKDERARADRLIQDERARADQRIKDAEERFHNKERDERERAVSEIQKIKDECERRLADQHRQMESRIADLDRNHQRDLASKEAAHAMQIETTKSTYEMRLDQARGEVKRAGTDIERYRKEAEENKDVVGKIAKLKDEAAALGMVDASEAGSSEPETFSQMLMKVGTNVAAGLPQIVETIGNMVKGKDEQALAQARLQGRQDMVTQAGQQFQPPGLPQAHARRGVPRLAPFQPISQATQAPLIPGHEPGRHNPATHGGIRPIPTAADLQPEEIMRQEALARQQQLEQQASLFVQQPEPMAPGPGADPFHTGMPPEPQMAPPVPALQSAPPPAFSQPPPAPQPTDPALAARRIEDQQIVQSLEGFVRPSYEAHVPPEALAEEFGKNFPKPQIREILTQLATAERLIEAFEREKGPDHPFARRDGKKYLRGLFAALDKVAG
jgi:hypothetical protein